MPDPTIPANDSTPERGKKPGRSDDELMKLAEDAAEAVDEVEEGAPTWMMTFGDLMSLLLVFFILLFSMSEIKLAKFTQAAESLREGLGLEPKKIEIPKSSGEPEESKVEEEFKKISSKIENFIESNDMASIMEVKSDSELVTLKVKDVALFRAASADICPENMWMVDKLVELTKDIDVPVVIAGHTDANPINTERFPSNWELSTARASRVAREIINRGYPPEHIWVEGHAEFSPVASNRTAEGRAKNRRVEMLYSKELVAEKLSGVKK